MAFKIKRIFFTVHERADYPTTVEGTGTLERNPIPESTMYPKTYWPGFRAEALLYCQEICGPSKQRFNKT
jgi:hypothetical protein